MSILALDSSTDWLSVAVGDDRRWHERQERAGTAASERVIAMIDESLREAGLHLDALEGIAFGAGPGSFTGVRIACGVTQGLALGARLQVCAIPSLEALAQATWRRKGAQRVVACLDARMREVYVAAYQREADAVWAAVLEPQVRKPDELTAPIAHIDDASGVLGFGPAQQGATQAWHGAGDGFAAYPALAGRMNLASVLTDLFPDARSIGELALPRFAAGMGVPAAQAEPLYVRHRVALTSAERAAGARL